MACLRLTGGPEKGRVFKLAGSKTLIGRGLDNQIALSDPSASRIHAQISLTPSGFVLSDERSSHGVFVNGVKISSTHVLQPNDSIRIGSTDLLFEEEQESKPTAQPDDDQRILGNQPVPEDFGKTIKVSVDVAEASSSQFQLSQDQAAVLSQVAEAIRSVFDTEELLRILIRLVFDIFKPDRGVVLLRNDADGSLAAKIVWPENQDMQVSRTVVDHAIRDCKSVLISDIGLDDRFSGANSILAQNIRWAICSPLICRDTVYGALYIDAQRPQMVAYTRNDVALLNILASQAAIALENAVLVQQKIQSERMAAIGVAIAGISHYVKNVLFGVSGSSGLIDQGLERNDLQVVAKIWPVMKRSTAKITELVQDMLTYSKKREPEWQQGNLNKLVAEVFEGLEERARTAAVDLRMSIDENVSDSFFDPKTVFDAVLNLAGNAVDACSGQPDAIVEISTRFEEDGQMQIVCVADNGPGIPAENQKKIFEPFFSTKGSKGTGLGLAVARKGIEEHEGRLELKSAVGEGATFTIVLPLRTVAPG